MQRALASFATGAAGLALLLCVAAPALPQVAGALMSRAGTTSLTGLAVPAPFDAGAPALATNQPPLPHGTLVLVRNTPHFWVADEQGVLHWASGTRALVGRYVRWSDQRAVSAAELEQLPRGEPWLLSPISFVRTDGSELYAMVWQSGVTWPALLSAPGIEALGPFGITPEHIARFSTDVRSWERLYGLPVEEVAAELTPLSASAAALRAWWSERQWSGTGAQVSPPDTYPIQMTLSQPRVDPNLGVLVGSVRYDSFPCAGFLGLISAGVINGEEEALLSERLDTGVESCTIQGRVTLTRRTDRRLFYTWSLPDRSMAVSGLLLRD